MTRPRPASADFCGVFLAVVSFGEDCAPSGVVHPTSCSLSRPVVSATADGNRNSYKYDLICDQGSPTIHIIGGYSFDTGAADESLTTDQDAITATWTCPHDPWIAPTAESCSRAGLKPVAFSATGYPYVFYPPDSDLSERTQPFSTYYLDDQSRQTLFFAQLQALTNPPAAGPLSAIEVTSVTASGSTAASLFGITPANEFTSVTATGCAACSVFSSTPAPTGNLIVTATETCTPSWVGATAALTKVTDCTLVFTAQEGSPFNKGTTLQLDTITSPNATFSGPGSDPLTTRLCENGVGGGGVLSNSNQAYTCIVGPILVTGATQLCATVQIQDPLDNSSDKLPVCPSGSPTATSSLSFTVVKTCGPFTPATPVAGGTSQTDCVLVFTPGSGSTFPSDVYVGLDQLTESGLSFSLGGRSSPTELDGSATSGFCINGVSAGTLGVVSGVSGTSALTLTCALPPIVVQAANFTGARICETVELGSPSLGYSSKLNVCSLKAPTLPDFKMAIQAVGPDQPLTAGNIASYDLVVANLGARIPAQVTTTDPVVKQPQVQVSIQVTGGVQYSSMGKLPTDWTCTGTTSPITCAGPIGGYGDPGPNTTVTLRLQVLGAKAGIIGNITATADPNGLIQESDKTNNTKTIRIPVN